MISRPTAADVLAYRDEHKVSIFDAKRAIAAAWRKDVLLDLHTKLDDPNVDVRIVLKDLIGFLHSVEIDG